MYCIGQDMQREPQHQVSRSSEDIDHNSKELADPCLQMQTSTSMPNLSQSEGKHATLKCTAYVKNDMFITPVFITKVSLFDDHLSVSKRLVLPFS